jgi:hypothetical protein
MKDRHVSPWLSWIVGSVGPGVEPVGCRMTDQLKYLNNAIPNRLALKLFFNRNTTDVFGFDAM